MFKQNIGNIERILRVLVGAALILGYFLSDGAYSWLYLLGIIPLATGVIGYCPPYAWLGINTCKRS
ncbi:YgaP family membrane protein [Roseovarius indicus]|uniref:Inner membrane protein YgaP-like transmembrane domain-containing protein n=1 Tax=Roseovarius indicus TaxID=540747 RepID=A0A0T5PAM0_9RHOB|nr:DUF2892 domain-containing protein [Roseovarius indicus]KRS17902.1 hypothetical protein XM52_10085 [Roseovarius indicus]QEW27287.1 hypothetical protein RIdsm_03099 [Roseovarius indicus]SFD50857.1 Protein of unknown function [Roseovarius indicus]